MEELGKSSQGQLRGDLVECFSKAIHIQLRCIDRGFDEDSIDERDYSIYTGVTGYALLYLHLNDKLGMKENMLRGLEYVEHALRHLKSHKYTFLCGDAGPLAVGAVLYDRLSQQDKSKKCIQKLVALSRNVCVDVDMPDEVLFGKCGYLYALLFVRKYLGNSVVDSDVIIKVFRSVISSGQRMSHNLSSPCPLMYAWHDKHYLGAAHGMAGIFYMLMQVKEPEVQEDLIKYVRPCIEHLMTMKYPSGNYPSSIGSPSGDTLVHWCHGAPGWIHMFAKAYQVFGDERYRQAALDCGNVIWERGLLKKGHGICHGAAGNGFAFLVLYKLTKDEQHLYRATKFAEWCAEPEKHKCHTPDRPYSLFEGIAGSVYFLADIQDPANANFPAFEI